jgi:hypothetical protein
MKKITLFIIAVQLCLTFSAFSQAHTLKIIEAVKRDTFIVDSSKQRDVVDYLDKLFHKDAAPDKREKAKKFVFSLVPSVGYSLSTGFAVDLSGNVTFYTNPNKRDVNSYINAQVFYDSRTQKSFFTQSNIWVDNDKTVFVTDLRLMKYPENTYGLGSFTTDAQQNPIDYNYFRLYETVLRKIANNMFIGGGYNMDYHYHISEEGNADNTISDFKRYGEPITSMSSGINLAVVYDSRKNAINPIGGSYANIVFRQNTTLLGSDNNWESLQADFRKYIKVNPGKNNNVLAFWSMLWFNFNGNAPYLDLPGTGWDTFNNLGRGYVIGRYRGRELLYLESEYRFGITKNGLLGGVTFANAQSFSEYPNNAFKKVIPAVGAGLRVKVNKHSNTNVCLDYAYGFNNSKGFFVNLGEMF